MEILIAIILIAAGLALIFYFRPKAKSDLMEMQFMQTKTIAELVDMFSQMDASGLGDSYREYVELKGRVVSNNLVKTPFSNRDVAYCDSSLSQVTEVREQYRDSEGNQRTRVNKKETVISSEQTSQTLNMIDNSTNQDVTLQVNGVGCKLDIPKTFDRFEPKNNLGSYGYFSSFSWNRYGAETLGFKMVEKTIDKDQNLYVIGEAYRSGDQIYIGKPSDAKKPFIVSTKSEEELVHSSNQKAMYMLIGGIAIIAIGAIVVASYFMG